MQDLINKLKKAKEEAFIDIITTAKIETENFVHRSFDKEGFINKGLSKWQPVKRKKGGKILTETRHLVLYY